MPPMPSEEYRSRYKLTEDLKIGFLGPLEPEKWPTHWPEARRRLFHDIVKLGDSKFGTFERSYSSEKPWRAQIKRRAAKLAYLASRCRDEGKNEPSWRASLEHEVLYRFTVEVSCPTCRARLWRSEIEAAIESSDSQALSLDERRKHRMPCRCPEGLGTTDFHGVNMIFSDRAETSIHYQPPLPIRSRSKGYKKYEQPDRVYGLIETQNIKTLLDSPYQRTTDSQVKQLRDLLEVSPFKGDRKPLLFPFLLLEAKSATVGDSAGVEMQSAFTIHRLLKVQDELRAATRVDSMWATGPLVWFFGWHGQDWYVKGNFIDYTSGSPHRYCIVDLWQGNICQQSRALQLLLIVDYIFDWARDVYRPCIIRELSILAAREMQPFDPDIFSTVDRSQSQIASELPGFSWSQESNLLHLSTTGPESALGDTHSPFGVVRDASNIETRFLSLHITEANVDELWGSLPAHLRETATTFVDTLRPSLDSSWRVTRKTLFSIQAAWTGDVNAPEFAGGINTDIASDEIFFTNIVILFHMTDDWTLVRQLTYLAISEGALQVLLSRHSLPGLLRDLEARTPIVDRSSIELFIMSIRRQTIASSLTAAVSMLCISSSCTRGPGRIPGKWLLSKAKNIYAGFVFDNSPSTLEIVAAFHETREKMIVNYLDDPYLVYSRTRTFLPTDSPEQGLWLRLDSICQDKHGCALVESLNLSHNSTGAGARFCLFIISKYDFDRSDVDTATIVRGLAEGGLYYSALQLDPSQRVRECYGYLNRSTKGELLWRNADSRGLLLEWVEDLGSQLGRAGWSGGGPGETPDSPIMISSSEESEGDPMEED